MKEKNWKEELVKEIKDMKQKFPPLERKCINLESHLYGSCFQCEKIKGYNQACDDLIQKLEQK